MYTGIHERKIDSKRRLVFPNSYKNDEELTYLVLRRDSLDNLFLFGGLEDVIEKNIPEISVVLGSPIIEFYPDNHGRVLLPKFLISFITDSERNTVILGNGDYFSVYSPEKARKILESFEN